MLGFGTKQPVAETEADGEIERVYHEIRQVLRVTGVNLNFRTWAMHEKVFPEIWDAICPTLQTRTFENACDDVRRNAVDTATKLPRIDAFAQPRLGESQRYQIQAALDLYHYINPKLLMLTCAVRQALEGEPGDAPSACAPVRIESGEPSRMFPMEMVEENPDDTEINALFKDIKTTLGLSHINSDYRTLALWPGYLSAAWQRLKPVIEISEYRQAADQLRASAQSMARSLPRPASLTRDRFLDLSGDLDAFIEKTKKFEQLLPPLIMNIALLSLDSKPVETLRNSPFPAAARDDSEVYR